MSARVVHFHRRPFPGQYSIEMLFTNLRAAMQSPKYEVVAAEAPEFSKGLRARLANCRWAARNQGDVNHVTGDVHYLALTLDPARTVLTVHDCLALERLGGLRRRVLKRYWFELPVKHVAAVTVISEETRRELVRHVPAAAEKTVVIPNAVAPMFRPCPRPFNESRPRILHIGTKPNKNLPRLIEAITGLTCRLHIIGLVDETLRRKLEGSGVDYEANADFSEAEMYRAYCNADLVTFTSTSEGFGMPIVEAQWVERPVVTSNCSSMPEVAGDGACLVHPYDMASIRAGIARVIGDADYRRQLVEAGRRNRERFSLSAVAAQYVALYDRMLAGQPAGMAS